MPLYLSDSSRSFQPAPEGLHAAVCVDCLDLGLQTTQFGTKHRIELRWLIDELNENGKPFLVSKRYTASLNERSRLRADLEAWRGKKFTPAELKRLDVEEFIGLGCCVQVVHAPSADGTRTWANVQNLVPLAKGMSAPAASGYVRKQDRVEELDVDLPADAPF